MKCKRCGLGIDHNQDGDCAVCAHWSEEELSKFKQGESTMAGIPAKDVPAQSAAATHIDHLFQFHKLNEVGIQRALHIADTFTRCLRELETLVPTSTRELSIVKTKLEEACFFAKKAMANSPQNQV